MKTVALAEIAEIERKSVAPSDIDEGETYVGLEHITSDGGFINVDTVAKGELQSSKFRFNSSHILYGKLRPYLAKIASPTFSGVCGTDILPIKPGPEVDQSYLMRFLRSPEMVAEASRLAQGANLPRLSPSALAAFQIPLPSIEEQRRFASILDAADALRTKRRQALAELDILESSLTERLLAGPSLGDLVPLASVVERITVGYVGPTSEFFAETGVPFIRTGNVGKRGEIDFTKLNFITPEFHARLQKSCLKAGDLLISRVISDQVRGALVPTNLEGANCANVIIVRPGEHVPGRVLLALLHSPWGQRKLVGRRVGSAQSVVNTSVLQEWLVPVLSDGKMREFNLISTKLETVRHSAEENLSRLNVLFASLQHRAFRGEL